MLDTTQETTDGPQHVRMHAVEPGGRAAGDSVQLRADTLYAYGMDVAVSELRAHLSSWLDRVREGDEVVITDRGVPVARILGLTTASTLEQLTRQGIIARPARPSRPTARGRDLPRSRRPLADIVSEQRG
jgi:prevent-host-death family protein